MPLPRPTAWHFRDGSLALSRRTLVMGIVNVTPDSFSDGGQHARPTDALAHALRLAEEGADIIDIGGESTRPGSEPVAPAEETRRVVPVIEALRGRVQVPLSIDTRNVETARAALAAGAHIVNDVTGGRDPRMAPLVAEHGAGFILMHMHGEPKTMQRAPHYDDVVRHVRDHLDERARAAQEAGVPPENIMLDPGLGFGKRTGHGIEDNMDLLRRLPELIQLGYPVLVGASRKTFLANLTDGAPPQDRLEASLAAACIAAAQGAHAVRVHDVRATRRALAVADALRPPPGT